MSGEEVYVDENMIRRMRDCEITIPICFGSIAFPLGKKAQNDFTHEWTVYVRGPNNDNLTLYVKQINIHLHSTFAQPVRPLFGPIYEVTEYGWGEFEVKAEIVFHDEARLPPMFVSHYLKLYEEGQSAQTSAANLSTKPVVRETYDEIVIWEPPESYYRRVHGIKMSKAAATRITPHLPTHSEDEEARKIQAAREKVFNALQQTKRTLGLLPA